jgi:hypothetical protein
MRRGWGAKVIDRLAADLRHAFPEMKGFSPRNLKYMRAIAEAYPDAEIVQQPVAQIPWGHNLRILRWGECSGRARMVPPPNKAYHDGCPNWHNAGFRVFSWED